VSMGVSNIHTVFSAECNPIFDWHSIALFHSHRTSGQPGGITRLLACDAAKLETYQGLDIGPTFVHENQRHYHSQNYAAFNKPASVMYWTRSGKVPEGVEYVMQLDADMLINRRVIPENIGARLGQVVSAPYDYLVGTTSGLAERLGVNATRSRMARCGGMHVFHLDDLTRIAPRWLANTRKVREFACDLPDEFHRLAAPPKDPKAAIKEGSPAKQETANKDERRQFMWMVEMYGYIFGAAEAGIGSHRVHDAMMGYVGQVSTRPGPFILHYGIDWSVDSAEGVSSPFHFNKLTYVELDATSCPGWFFPVLSTPVELATTFRAQLCLRQMRDFNTALCEYYGRHCRRAPHCPPEHAVSSPASPADGCYDRNPACLAWSQMSECEANPGFMRGECTASCGQCPGDRPMMGAPGNCADVDAAAGGGAEYCANAIKEGACVMRRAEMQASLTLAVFPPLFPICRARIFFIVITCHFACSDLARRASHAHSSRVSHLLVLALCTAIGFFQSDETRLARVFPHLPRPMLFSNSPHARSPPPHILARRRSADARAVSAAIATLRIALVHSALPATFARSTTSAPMAQTLAAVKHRALCSYYPYPHPPLLYHHLKRAPSRPQNRAWLPPRRPPPPPRRLRWRAARRRRRRRGGSNGYGSNTHNSKERTR